MTNQYLPFATAGGANVLSPADYSALAARLAGFAAGTALSEQLNSVWRQSSVISAMIGQFIGDIGGFDALDDGSVANVLTSFERSLQNGKLNYGVVGGTANALTVALTPAPAAVASPLSIIASIAITNTGAATLNVNSLGAKPIVRPNLQPTQAGDLLAGAYVRLVYDGTSFQIASPLPSQTSNSGSQIITTTGNFTVSAGVTRLRRVTVVGTGGGGGAATGGGAGGSAGGISIAVDVPVTPGQVIPATMGTPGAGGNGTPTAGSPGGTTSFGSILTVPGGLGGAPGNSGTAGATSPGATPTGGALNLAGGVGGGASLFGSTYAGGVGGGTPFASGPSPGTAINGTGSSANFPGGGGGGGAANSGGQAGAVGAGGIIIVEW